MRGFLVTLVFLINNYWILAGEPDNVITNEPVISTVQESPPGNEHIPGTQSESQVEKNNEAQQSNEKNNEKTFTAESGRSSENQKDSQSSTDAQPEQPAPEAQDNSETSNTQTSRGLSIIPDFPRPKFRRPMRIYTPSLQPRSSFVLDLMTDCENFPVDFYETPYRDFVYRVIEPNTDMYIEKVIYGEKELWNGKSREDEKERNYDRCYFVEMFAKRSQTLIILSTLTRHKLLDFNYIIRAGETYDIGGLPESPSFADFDDPNAITLNLTSRPNRDLIKLYGTVAPESVYYLFEPKPGHYINRVKHGDKVLWEGEPNLLNPRRSDRCYNAEMYVGLRKTLVILLTLTNGRFKYHRFVLENKKLPGVPIIISKQEPEPEPEPEVQPEPTPEPQPELRDLPTEERKPKRVRRVLRLTPVIPITIDLHIVDETKCKMFDMYYDDVATKMFFPGEDYVITRVVYGNIMIWEGKDGEKCVFFVVHFYEGRPSYVSFHTEELGGLKAIYSKKFVDEKLEMIQPDKYKDTLQSLQLHTPFRSTFVLDINSDEGSEKFKHFVTEYVGVITKFLVAKPGYHATKVVDGATPIWEGKEGNGSDKDIQRCHSLKVHYDENKPYLIQLCYYPKRDGRRRGHYYTMLYIKLGGSWLLLDDETYYDAVLNRLGTMEIVDYTKIRGGDMILNSLDDVKELAQKYTEFIKQKGVTSDDPVSRASNILQSFDQNREKFTEGLSESDKNDVEEIIKGFRTSGNANAKVVARLLNLAMDTMDKRAAEVEKICDDGVLGLKFVPRDGYAMPRITQDGCEVWVGQGRENCLEARIYFDTEGYKLVKIKTTGFSFRNIAYRHRVDGGWVEVDENGFAEALQEIRTQTLCPSSSKTSSSEDNRRMQFDAAASNFSPLSPCKDRIPISFDVSNISSEFSCTILEKVPLCKTYRSGPDHYIEKVTDGTRTILNGHKKLYCENLHLTFNAENNPEFILMTIKEEYKQYGITKQKEGNKWSEISPDEYRKLISRMKIGLSSNN